MNLNFDASRRHSVVIARFPMSPKPICPLCDKLEAASTNCRTKNSSGSFLHSRRPARTLRNIIPGNCILVARTHATELQLNFPWPNAAAATWEENVLARPGH